MTPALLLLITAALVLTATGAVVLILRRALADQLARLEAGVATFTDQLGQRVHDSAAAARDLTTIVNARMGEAGRSLAELQERLGRLDEASRQVERVGQSVAELERVLASPKRRGGMGELALEALLEDALPREHILTQHRLPSRGTVVDIALRLAGGALLAIDSKFPLEAYRRVVAAETGGEDPEPARRELQRAVQRQIDEIATRYISPDDGTLELALMYIPSEAVYHELVTRDVAPALLAYARERRVVPCSPGTLHAYVQAIAIGVRGEQVARDVREIRAALEHLRQEAVATRSAFDRAANQLRHALGNFEAAGEALARLEGRLAQTAGGAQAADGAQTADGAQAGGATPLLAEERAEFMI
jgi:DNA recombination protein RmuC